VTSIWQGKTSDNSDANLSLANSCQVSNSSGNFTLDNYIFIAFQVANFLLILQLPLTLGYFIGNNKSALHERFVWFHREGIIVISTLLFVSIETISLSLDALKDMANGNPTEGIIHVTISFQLINIISSLLQLTVLLVVSSSQFNFVQKITNSSKTTSVPIISNLLEEYENMKKGVGPLYTIEFCVHAPIILCFAYFGLSRAVFSMILWSSGKIIWSSLTLIHICLMSEYCYDAVQDLVPAIR
jgi:hypothetical protein